MLVGYIVNNIDYKILYMLFKFKNIIPPMFRYRASRTFKIALCCTIALCALSSLVWWFDMITAKAAST